MNIYEKLNKIQTELKAPKGQFNSFGKYKYRSCEDILEAVKPFLADTKTVLTISDDIVSIGDRFYVKAVADLRDCENENSCITNTAFAREDDTKKGMDGSQVTGAASSYARKYALNGLFAIDDTKDADANENAPKTQNNAPHKPSKDDLTALVDLCKRKGIMDIKKAFPKGIENLTAEQYRTALEQIGRMKDARTN
jgi:hypothetical protein